MTLNPPVSSVPCLIAAELKIRSADLVSAINTRERRFILYLYGISWRIEKIATKENSNLKIPRNIVGIL